MDRVEKGNLEFLKKYAWEFGIAFPKNCTEQEAREWIMDSLKIGGMKIIEGECSEVQEQKVLTHEI